MRISIHTLGTRGDFQPYLALARALRANMHTVQVVAPEQFGDMAAAEGVAFVPLPAAFLDILDTDDAKTAIGRSSGGFGAGFNLLKHYVRLMRSLFDCDWQAAQDFRPDALLFHAKCLAVPHIAAKLNIPCFLASPLPGFTPTAAFPAPVVPFGSLGPFNRASHALMIHGGSLLFRRTIREWRQSVLGLSPSSPAAGPLGTLYGYSPLVLPRPADWGQDVSVTGYWTLESPDWTPDAALQQFLAAGEKPVYVGFGSMPESDPIALTQKIVAGLRLAGKRGLVLTGRALTRLEGEDMFFIEGAPHERLFPLVQSTLHHGGAGTTGAALRAGKPTLICPFLGDQPFWARRVQDLGVGPQALDRRRMEPADIARAIMAMDDAQMRQRAARLGLALQGENGVAAAVSFVETRMSVQ
jgi:sterol 3beta-glucosyltransferase